MPFGRIDPEGYVDLDDFDAGDVAGGFPRVGRGFMPCCAHTAWSAFDTFIGTERSKVFPMTRTYRTYLRKAAWVTA